MSKYLFILLFSGCVPAFAQLSDVRQVTASSTNGQLSFRNFVINPDCRLNTSNITASGGTLTRNTGSATLDAISECQWDASASAQTLKFDLDSFPSGVSGANCEAKITKSSTDGLIQAYIEQNSIAITSSPVLVSGASSTSLNYPCGATATKVVLQSTADAAPIKVGIYSGLATNLSNVAQARYVGGIRWFTSNCIWVNNASNSPLLPSADSDCPTSPEIDGSAVAPGTKVPQVTFTGLTAGKKYVASFIGGIIRYSANTSASVRINDGTNYTSGACYTDSALSLFCPTSINHVFTASSSSITISAHLIAGSGTASLAGLNASDNPVEIRLYEYPSSSEIAVRADLAASFWTGYHDSTCGGWTRTNTAYGDFAADASCALTQLNAKNISCVATGSVLPAIACTFPRPGDYKVCLTTAGTISAGANHSYQLTDGTTAQAWSSGYNSYSPNMCGTWQVTGTTKTFTLQGKSASGTVTMDAQGATATAVWSVEAITNNTPAPVLVGSVTSNSTGQERIERAYIVNSAGTPGISSQSGVWISSITDSGIGNYVANFVSGIWSAAPTCVMTCASADSIPRTIHATTSSASFTCDDANTGSRIDDNMEILCMGPR